jgi:hypothetical protein
MHSWRVLILPFLDEQRLYNEYDFSEPWDGPNNSKLASKMPPTYACSSSATHRYERGETTNYVAVVGPHTSWPGSVGRRFRDITDGLTYTILVVESNPAGVPWMAPIDLKFDDALIELTTSAPKSQGGHGSEDFFHKYQQFGRHVLFGDGSVRYAPQGNDRDIWSKLLTINDNSSVDDWASGLSDSTTPRKLNMGNCIRLAIFVFLLFLPLPWVWWNPTSSRGGPDS